jgi:hypothetical protein
MRMSQGGREPHPKGLLQNTGTLQGSQKGKAAWLYRRPRIDFQANIKVWAGCRKRERTPFVHHYYVK